MDDLQRKALFESAPISRAVIKLAVPTIISQTVTIIYNLADTLYVGMTGDAEMVAAVSICAPVLTFLVSIINLFGIGGSSVISRALGSNDKERAKAASTFAILFSLVSSAVISLISLFTLDGLAKVVGANEGTLAYTKDYLFWTITAGAVPTTVGTVLGIIVRTDGNSLHSGIGMTLGGILNVILDPIFLFTFHMGVAGVAIATMLSNAVALLYFVLFLIFGKKNTIIGFYPKLLKEAMKTFRPVFLIGSAAALNTFLVSIAMIILDNFAVAYGNDVMAAIGVVKKIDTLPWGFMFGLTQGVLPLVGYNYASGNHKRMKDAIKFTLIAGSVFNVICIAFFEIFPALVCGIFIRDNNVVGIASGFLRLYCTCVPFMSIGYILNSTFQAVGEGRRSLVLAVCRHGLYFIPLLLLMNAVMQADGLVLTQTLSDFLFAATGAVFMIHFLKKLKIKGSGSGKRGILN
jgi:putative efflux protein, MATE family